MDLPLGLLGLASAGFEQSRYLLPYPYPDRHRPGRPRGPPLHAPASALVRRFGESLRLGGHVNWARRVSSLPLFSYEGLRYGLTAEIVP